MIYLAFLIGLVVGYYIRFWPKLYRRIRGVPIDVHLGRLTCILYDAELLTEHSRVVMKVDSYPPEVWRPHGKTLPTKYRLLRVAPTHGIYQEVK